MQWMRRLQVTQSLMTALTNESRTSRLHVCILCMTIPVLVVSFFKCILHIYSVNQSTKVSSALIQHHNYLLFENKIHVHVERCQAVGYEGKAKQNCDYTCRCIYCVLHIYTHSIITPSIYKPQRFSLTL